MRPAFGALGNRSCSRLPFNRGCILWVVWYHTSLCPGICLVLLPGTTTANRDNLYCLISFTMAVLLHPLFISPIYQRYNALCIWKMQLLDERHLLLKYGSKEHVGSRSQDSMGIYHVSVPDRPRAATPQKPQTPNQNRRPKPKNKKPAFPGFLSSPSCHLQQPISPPRTTTKTSPNSKRTLPLNTALQAFGTDSCTRLHPRGGVGRPFSSFTISSQPR